MSDSTIRMVCLDGESPGLIATVEFDRAAGVALHRHVGQVDLVDHVTAWVLEGGIVLGATLRRSAIRNDRVIVSRDLEPVPQASLSAAERVDVLHAAGLRTFSAEAEAPRWEVA